MKTFQLAVLLCGVLSAYSNKLPSFITKCSMSDPEVGNCIADRMRIAIPKVINGNKQLRIPNLNPFHMQEVQIQATETLSLKLIDIDIFGLDKAKVGKVVSDIKNFKAHVELSFDELQLSATYDIQGRLMILPIQGHGPANITMKNVRFVFDFAWEMVTDDKGIEYSKLGDSELHYTAERSYYHFDNLFNGDKALGDQMNAFIEENWREVSKEIEPSVSETIKIVVMGIFSDFSISIPFNEMFDP